MYIFICIYILIETRAMDFYAHVGPLGVLRVS